MKGIMILISLLSIINGHANEELNNYYICKAKILKNGKELSSHLVTTYRPMGTYMPTKAYHSVHTISSRCMLLAFNKKYNKKHIAKDGKNYVDLCFVIGNGVRETENGDVRFYLVKKPTSDVFQFNYLNKEDPLYLEGNDSQTRAIGEYELEASCENKMLSRTDQIWTEIRKSIFGK